MKPTNSPIVALGPALQCIRGLLFAAVFYPFWNFILNHKHSVWLLWSLFLGLAILGACGAMPGSFEGMIYTIIPIKTQFLMLPEIVIQTLMFSAGLIVWYRYPRKWYNVMMIILLVAIVFMSTAGYIALSNGL